MGGKRSGPDWTLILSFAFNIVLIFLIQIKLGQPTSINIKDTVLQLIDLRTFFGVGLFKRIDGDLQTARRPLSNFCVVRLLGFNVQSAFNLN